MMTNPALDRTMKTLNDQVFPALREGGLDISRDDMVLALSLDMWAGEAREFMFIDVTNERGYRLFVSLRMPSEEDPKNPEVVQVSVGLSSVERATGVLFTRFTDEPWKESYLNTPDDRPLDDRQAFEAIMKAARLYRHNTP